MHSVYGLSKQFTGLFNNILNHAGIIKESVGVVANTFDHWYLSQKTMKLSPFNIYLVLKFSNLNSK